MTFVEFGKQHLRYKAILLWTVLSQQCCEVYFIPFIVAKPLWDLTSKCYWNRPPPKLTDWIRPCWWVVVESISQYSVCEPFRVYFMLGLLLIHWSLAFHKKNFWKQWNNRNCILNCLNCVTETRTIFSFFTAYGRSHRCTMLCVIF